MNASYPDFRFSNAKCIRGHHATATPRIAIHLDQPGKAGENVAGLVAKHGIADGALVYTPLAKPNAAQRRMVSIEYEPRLHQRDTRCVALLSDSAAIRGVFRTLGWLLRNQRQQMRCFSPTCYSTALEWIHEEISFDVASATDTFQQVLPPAETIISSGTMSAFLIAGHCTAWEQSVVISGAVSASVPCEGGVWNAVLDLSNVPDGTVDLFADHQDSTARAAPQFSRRYVKDTTPPAVAFTAPAAGSLIPQASLQALAVSGTCSASKA